jgi:hypothetical protein
VRRLLLTLCALALAGCAGLAPDMAQRRAPPDVALPPMKAFGAIRATPPARSNASIAADFLELSFRLESGRELPVFTRFEGPVTVRVAGVAPATLSGDLDRLIARLRDEAGIAITRVPAAQAASITIETLPRAELQRPCRRPPASSCRACQAGPSSAANRRSARALDWTTLRVRARIAVFVPSDVAPQEVRDCLHEEVAQALGPLNDLYRLPDSVFNDDNFHTVLTGFDMLVLRATYDPELASGMTRAEVAARLPAILARLNPGGEGITGFVPRAHPPRLDRRGRNRARTRTDPRTPRAAAAEAWPSPAPRLERQPLGFALYARGGSTSVPRPNWRWSPSSRPGRSSAAAHRPASMRPMWTCSLPPSPCRPGRPTGARTSTRHPAGREPRRTRRCSPRC